MVAQSDEAPEAAPTARVFISYSRKDMAFADRLDAALKARGYEPLIDRTEIYAFEDWWKRIQALIGKADTVVFVLSPDAVASEVALKEVTHAASLNKRFAPIVCRRVDERAIPEALQRLNFIFFDDPARFEESADRLAEALQTDIGWVRQHTEFGEAALRWARAGRPGGLLLRSPVLEEAERWIATRPRGAPEPTAETQAFVAASRHGTTRRRNILTGSLAAGLVVALALAGLAYWQRGIAVEQQRIANEQRQLAEQQRQRAEATLAAATKTANSLVFDLAQRFRDTIGIPASLVKDILDRARALQEQLIKSGQVTPELKGSEAAALNETATSLLAIGDTAGALAAAEQARQIMADLLAGNPESTQFQRALSVSYNKVGDVQVAQGDLAGALKSYRDSLAIRERLAQSDPGNAGWQRELSVSYNRVGNVQVAQGDLAGALKSYRDGLAIAERLAQSDPGNAGWQRDLTVSYTKVGNVQVAQGDLAGALKSYGDDLAIAERLAQSDPGNASWQRDLAISYAHLASVYRRSKDRGKALAALRQGKAIMDRLVKLAPDNVGWQRDLAWLDQQIAALPE
jgi:tetratricopeptide (TPR) repeat protein